MGDQGGQRDDCDRAAAGHGKSSITRGSNHSFHDNPSGPISPTSARVGCGSAAQPIRGVDHGPRPSALIARTLQVIGLGVMFGNTAGVTDVSRTVQALAAGALHLTFLIGLPPLASGLQRRP